jgi:EmrB/QacA subfamily drug resistance transporter
MPGAYRKRMDRNQRLVLVASILGSFVAFLDMSVVNVALPAIRAQLGGGLQSQQWVVDSYLLALGSLILIAGSLSDLFGRKRVFAAGLVGFAATSLLCAAAPGPAFLIAARGLQGAAGAMLVPSSLAMIVANFEGPSQGEAVGTWTAWTGISFILGPLLGGALVDAGSWRWVFAINVLPVAATLAVLARVRAEERRREGGGVDAAGAVLCAAGLGGVIAALIELPARGLRSPVIFVPLVAGVLAFGAFIRHERRSPRPMVDFGLFRSRNFAVGNLATVAIYAGLTAATFLITLFLQQVAGYSALRAGLALLPVTILSFLLAPLAGRLAGRLGPRLFMTVGPIATGAGFALMTRMDAERSYASGMLPGVLLFGLGLATTVAPLTAAVLGDVDERHAGIASAINNAIARVAGLLAVAAIGALVALRFAGSIAEDEATQRLAPEAQQFLTGAEGRALDVSVPAALRADARLEAILTRASVRAFRLGLWSMAGLLAAGGLVSAVGMRNRPRGGRNA